MKQGPGPCFNNVIALLLIVRNLIFQSDLSLISVLMDVSIYLSGNLAGQDGAIAYTELNSGTKRVVGADDDSILVDGVGRGHVLRHHTHQTAELQFLASNNREVTVGIEQDEGRNLVGPRGIEHHHIVGLAVPLLRLLHSGVGHPWNLRSLLALDDEVGNGDDGQQKQQVGSKTNG